jgi:hypothetical protein
MYGGTTNFGVIYNSVNSQMATIHHLCGLPILPQAVNISSKAM